MRTRLIVILVVAIFAPVFLVAQNAGPMAGGRLLALSKGDRTLSVIDPATLKVLGKVPSGDDPHEVAASADGRWAYVSNYGAGRGGFNTLTIGDIVNFKPAGTVDLGGLRGPHGMTEAGGKIFFTAEVAKAIGRVDPATNKVDWVLGTGRDITHMVVVSKDLQRMFSVDVQSATASIIERAQGRAGRFAPAANDDWTVTSVKVGDPAEDFEGFDVSPDGNELWTASPRGKITIVDTVGKKVAQTMELPSVTGANRVKFTLDGKLVLVSRLSFGRGGGSGTSVPSIIVFDRATRKETKQINTGGGVGGLLMQPDGTRAYGSARDGVVAIDLKTLSVIGKIDVGPNPDGLAWANAVK
jgi:YVTN family beta-propeller protein